MGFELPHGFRELAVALASNTSGERTTRHGTGHSSAP